MKTIKYVILAIVSLIIIVFFVSYIVWLSYPKTYLNVYILDKTVPDFSYEKHRSLFWVLNNSKIAKRNGKNYKVGSDYYGFHPLKPLSDCQYEIKRISIEQIDSVASSYDVAYYTDTRGVYFNEWFRGFRQHGENSVIEGGLNQNDYLLLKTMRTKDKLIIGEYNILGTPTSDLISYKTEELFSIRSTGWTGCYYESLDSNNNEIPPSIIAKYKSNNNGSWPFKKEGIILSNNNNVIVLENKVHLIKPLPTIVTKSELLENYNLPDYVEFYNTFEIVTPADSAAVIANFQINVTAEGDSVLNMYGLKSIFPAIIVNNPQKIRTCYFAGDFTSNKVWYMFARMANSRQILKSITHKGSKKKFFQYYYFPFIENMLKTYSKEIQ